MFFIYYFSSFFLSPSSSLTILSPFLPARLSVCLPPSFAFLLNIFLSWYSAFSFFVSLFPHCLLFSVVFITLVLLLTFSIFHPNPSSLPFFPCLSLCPIFRVSWSFFICPSLLCLLASSFSLLFFLHLFP